MRRANRWMAALFLLGAVFMAADWGNADTAASITINNSAFDLQDIPTNPGYIDGVITDWTTINGASGVTLTSITGNSNGKAAYLYGDGSRDVFQTYFFQRTSAPLEAGKSYTLTADLVGSPGFASTSSGAVMAMLIGYANGSNDTTLCDRLYTFEELGTSAFQTKSITSDVISAAHDGLGGNLYVTFALMNSSSGAVNFFVDNVRLTTTTTPEPGTIALLCGAMTGLAAYAWRKRR